MKSVKQTAGAALLRCGGITAAAHPRWQRWILHLGSVGDRACDGGHQMEGAADAPAASCAA